MKRFVSVAVLFTALIVSLPAEGLQLDLGLGASYGNDYVGADETGVSPVLVVDLRYRGESFELFAGSLDGFGASVDFGDTGLYSSAGVEFGDSRDPDLKNYARAFGLVGWSKLFFTAETEASYYPIQRGSQLYHGAVVDSKATFAVPFFDETLIPQLTAGITFMNGGYATAWYDTDAKPIGVRSAYGKIDIIWQGFLPHTWLYAGYSVERLLGKAASGTHSVSDLSQKVSLFVAYRFKKR